MRADMTAALATADAAAPAGAPAARTRLRCLDAGAEPESNASALSLLFPVFLLLAALVATLAAKRPAHPATETAVLASLADRFALEGTAAEAADQDEAELLAALERLRPRPERDAAGDDETNPAALEGNWSVTFPAESFFAEV
jgi:hypothetical protein